MRKNRLGISPEPSARQKTREMPSYFLKNMLNVICFKFSLGLSITFQQADSVLPIYVGYSTYKTNDNNLEHIICRVAKLNHRQHLLFFTAQNLNELILNNDIYDLISSLQKCCSSDTTVTIDRAYSVNFHGSVKIS